MIKPYLLVFLGGGIGSLLRYLVVSHWDRSWFPLGTTAVNILGSLLIGLLMGWAARQQWLSANGLLLLSTGFCGGLTTFSAFSLQNVLLMEKSAFLQMTLYTMVSLLFSFGAVVLGLTISRP